TAGPTVARAPLRLDSNRWLQLLASTASSSFIRLGAIRLPVRTQGSGTRVCFCGRAQAADRKDSERHSRAWGISTRPFGAVDTGWSGDQIWSASGETNRA